MTLNEYIKYALSQKQIEYHSYDPRAKYHCVDLANDYITKVWGLKAIIGTNAKDFPEKLTDGMEFVKNTTEYLPEAGEVAVWNGRVGGGAGHISVVTRKGAQLNFNSLDQNWSKPLFITEENHTYTNVRGFIRKKETMPVKNELTECLAQHAKLVDEANKKDKTISGLEAEVSQKETKISELQASLEEKEGEIATLNKQVAAHKGEVTKKDTEITNLNTQIAQLKAESKKDVAGETSKESMRLLVSGAVGTAVTYLYSQYPFLGQLGIEESVAVAAIVGYLFRIADKAVHTIGKNIGSDALKAGLMRF
jgi:hypothetical protein